MTSNYSVVAAAVGVDDEVAVGVRVTVAVALDRRMVAVAWASTFSSRMLTSPSQRTTDTQVRPGYIYKGAELP